LLLALGWFINELSFIRNKISILDKQQSEVTATRFTNFQGEKMKTDILALERLLQTKVDAKDAKQNVENIRGEIRGRLAEIDDRLRTVEILTHDNSKQ
jgi:hypothetical protein